jgi:hypothetical protein
MDELMAATQGGHLGSTGGRFFAWVIAGAWTPGQDSADRAGGSSGKRGVGLGVGDIPIR